MSQKVMAWQEAQPISFESAERSDARAGQKKVREAETIREANGTSTVDGASDSHGRPTYDSKPLSIGWCPLAVPRCHLFGSDAHRSRRSVLTAG